MSEIPAIHSSIDMINKTLKNYNESFKVLGNRSDCYGEQITKLSRAFKISIWIMACNIICLIVILSVLLVRL